MPARREKRKKKTNETNAQVVDRTLVLRATVTRLATDPSENDDPSQSSTNAVDVDLIERLSKILDIAQQPGTSEEEAKQALQLIARMLSSANSEGSEALSLESAKNLLQKAGHSEIAINHYDIDHGPFEQWVHSIVCAIAKAFNVKAFHNSKNRDPYTKKTTFYGLRANAAAAALSFEAIINLVLLWAASHTNQNCYLLGVSKFIYQMAKDGEELEEIRALEAEKGLIEKSLGAIIKEKKEQSLHFCSSKSPKKSGIVVDENEEDIIFVKSKHKSKQSRTLRKIKEEVKEEHGDEGFAIIKQEHEDNEDRVISEKEANFRWKLEEEAETSGWKNHAKLMAFRQMAKRIAEEYFKKEWKGMELKKYESSRGEVRDFSAYERGKEDARKVDIKRRRLEAA